MFVKSLDFLLLHVCIQVRLQFGKLVHMRFVQTSHLHLSLLAKSYLRVR